MVARVVDYTVNREERLRRIRELYRWSVCRNARGKGIERLARRMDRGIKLGVQHFRGARAVHVTGKKSEVRGYVFAAYQN